MLTGSGCEMIWKTEFKLISEQDAEVNGMDLRLRICTKISRIYNFGDRMEKWYLHHTNSLLVTCTYWVASCDISKSKNQCFSGSVAFWYGSGCVSCSFRQRPSRIHLKKNSLSFYACSFLEVHLHHSAKLKCHKEVAKQ
jgi:hypothetical protein